MNSRKSLSHGHRFFREIIRHAVELVAGNIDNDWPISDADPS